MRKGALIPGTKARLQADNYGIHFRNLYHDFDGFVKFVTEQMPPDALTDEYPNPYTGEVIREHKIQYSVREKQIPAEAEESSEQPAKVSKFSFAAAIRDWIRQKIRF